MYSKLFSRSFFMVVLWKHRPKSSILSICIESHSCRNNSVISLSRFTGASLAQERGRLDVQIESQKNEILSLTAKLQVYFLTCLDMIN